MIIQRRDERLTEFYLMSSKQCYFSSMHQQLWTRQLNRIIYGLRFLTKATSLCFDKLCSRSAQVVDGHSMLPYKMSLQLVGFFQLLKCKQRRDTRSLMMEKVLLLVVLSSIVLSEVYTKDETCAVKNSQVFQYFEELLMSQNFILVTDGIRMKRKSFEKLFEVSEDDVKEHKDCGLLTLRQIESNIDKIMNNFVLEFDLSRVVIQGG